MAATEALFNNSPSEWRIVRMSDVLQRVERKIEINETELYDCVGVRWYGQGAFVRESELGLNIARKQQWVIKEGDVVYNKLFAWKGAFAVADSTVDGKIVSDKFPTYSINVTQLDPRFLALYFQTPLISQQAHALSKGAAAISKLTLNPPQFWQLTMPLPSLSEQKRIVSVVQQISGCVETIKLLRDQSEKTVDALCRSIMFSASDSTTPMRELLTFRAPDIRVDGNESYSFAGVYCFGRGVFPGQTKPGASFSYDRLTRLQAGDFIYPKLMAWEGALGVVPPECDGLFVSPEFPVFTVDNSRVLPDVLDLYFKSPAVWPDLAAISKGTNVRRRRLHPSAFLNYEMPLPPMDVQKKLCALIDKSREIHEMREHSERQLNALMPSVLDRAFSGRL